MPGLPCRLLHTYPGGWQVYLAPDGQEPQLLTVLVRRSASQSMRLRLLFMAGAWLG